jgi:PAS domain S-box-containing protein
VPSLKFLQPVRRRLPLLICALLLAVMAAFSAVTFHRFEGALLTAGDDRVKSASERLAMVMQESARMMRVDSRRFAGDSAIHRYLRTRDSRLIAAAEEALRHRLVASPHFFGVELRDIHGKRLLAVGGPPPAAAPLAEVAQWNDLLPLDTTRRVAIGPLKSTEGRVYYEILAPATDLRGHTIGYVTQYRHVASSAQSARLIPEVIGTDATVFLGNARGGLWSDLAHGGPVVVPNVVDRRVFTLPGRGGEPLRAMASRVVNAPWVVLVAIPQRQMLAPSRDLLGATAWLALFLLAAGALGAWLLSRRITQPIADIVRAAEGIAGGDYSRRVSAERRTDELGQLAESFNCMAGQIEDATSLLEARVAERSRELQAAQEALHRREREAGEARYRRLVETAHEGVWTIDASGVTDYVNPRMAEMLGYTPAEMIGRPIFDFLDDETRPLAAASVERRLRHKKGEVYERRLKRRDGSDVWTFMSTTPILGPSDECVGALAMVSDVTERRKLEAQLRQSQRLEAIGQLAGGIAHDFNNLLLVVKGHAEFALEDISAGHAQVDDIKTVVEAADRAAALTRQLLAFSRQQVLQPRVLDLNELVTSFAKMVRRVIPADIAIETKLAGDLGAIEADAGQLEQVLMNLVVNARDAMPRGGKVTIETSNADLDGTSPMRDSPPEVRPGSYVSLVVNDTGGGMDKETQARAFEPFFTTKERGNGTGLGLSTVYGIVKQSGGYIWVFSEPGQGTTLRIYMPRVPKPAGHVKTSTDRTEPARGGETVLVVDDEPLVRAVARRLLMKKGYRVLEAENGAEALRICEESVPSIDLVVTDLVMPEMGGRELAAELHARHAGVRILFMSGYTEDAALRTSVLQVGQAFLAKPFTADEFARKVREVLDDQPAVTAREGAYSAPRSRVKQPT